MEDGTKKHRRVAKWTTGRWSWAKKKGIRRNHKVIQLAQKADPRVAGNPRSSDRRDRSADVVIRGPGRQENMFLEQQAFYARDLAVRSSWSAGRSRRMTMEWWRWWNCRLLDGFARGAGAQVLLVRGRPAQPRLPMPVELHLQGRLPMDKFVSRPSAWGTSRRPSPNEGRGEARSGSVVTL